jgi:hypothetical protein
MKGYAGQYVEISLNIGMFSIRSGKKSYQIGSGSAMAYMPFGTEQKLERGGKNITQKMCIF